MQSTLSLFRHFAETLPPLVPPALREAILGMVDNCAQNPACSREDVEREMIKFGYEVWPWREAYNELYNQFEAKLGEHFLLPRLSGAVAARYEAFRTYGGTLSDLHSGRPADFFTPEERLELCVALVEMKRDLKRALEHEVSGLSAEKYLSRVEHFALVRDEIRATIENLRSLAAAEAENHPMLSDEIRSKVESFEHGLCLLGPAVNYEAVCAAPEHFAGRKHEFNRLRGIHQTVSIVI